MPRIAKKKDFTAFRSPVQVKERARYDRLRPTGFSCSVSLAYVRAWNKHDFSTLDTVLAPGGIHEDVAQNFRGKGPKEVAARP
jgi:hypothetical protein